MTSDLAARLRDLLRADAAHDYGPTTDTRLLREAADEIERLRAEAAVLVAGIKAEQDHLTRTMQRAERAEAERDALIHDIERSQDRNTALIAENAALRALLAEARSGAAEWRRIAQEQYANARGDSGYPVEGALDTMFSARRAALAAKEGKE